MKNIPVNVLVLSGQNVIPNQDLWVVLMEPANMQVYFMLENTTLWKNTK